MYMPSLGMQGTYNLTSTEIDSYVTRTSPGNYALGYVKDKTFFVKYVGRSDSDVNSRLKSHASQTKYKSYKFSYATSPKAAFEKECQNFHDFGGSKNLDNTIHPDRPNNNGWKCPVCNIYD